MSPQSNEFNFLSALSSRSNVSRRLDLRICTQRAGKERRLRGAHTEEGAIREPVSGDAESRHGDIGTSSGETMQPSLTLLFHYQRRGPEPLSLIYAKRIEV